MRVVLGMLSSRLGRWVAFAGLVLFAAVSIAGPSFSSPALLRSLLGRCLGLWLPRERCFFSGCLASGSRRARVPAGRQCGHDHNDRIDLGSRFARACSTSGGAVERIRRARRDDLGDCRCRRDDQGDRSDRPLGALCPPGSGHDPGPDIDRNVSCRLVASGLNFRRGVLAWPGDSRSRRRGDGEGGTQTADLAISADAHPRRSSPLRFPITRSTNPGSRRCLPRVRSPAWSGWSQQFTR